MRSAAKCICILLFLAGLTHASGQDMQTEVQPDGIEKQIDFAEAQPDYADVIYQEEALLKHPVNLNTSDKDALLKLTLLSPGHIEAIRDHIR